jgi:threonine dehydrogenase-like Zn-dependent dehydrogenase
MPPIIPGHEFVGEVVELGPGAGEKYGLEVGDHAISENIVPCWECRYCKRGNYNMCSLLNLALYCTCIASQYSCS